MKNPVERLADTLIHGDSQKAALVFSEKNRRYFTQFPATDGALLVTAEEAYLLMDFRYEEAARYKAQYCTVVGFDSLMGKLQELLQKHGVQEVYMECEQLSVAQARRFEEAFQKVGVQAVLDSTLDNAIRAELEALLLERKKAHKKGKAHKSPKTQKKEVETSPSSLPDYTSDSKKGRT